MATKTETLLNSLKINYLTEEQYNTALENNEINENEIYMTPSSESGGSGSDDYDIYIETVLDSNGWLDNITQTDEPGRSAECFTIQNASTDILTVFNKVYYQTETPKVLLKGSYGFNYAIYEDASIYIDVDNIIAHKNLGIGNSYSNNCGFLGFTINFTKSASNSISNNYSNLIYGCYGYLYMFIDLTTGEILEKGFEKSRVVDSHAANIYNLSVSGSSQFGYSLTVKQFQSAFGHYNNESLATGGDYTGTTGTAIVVGNGTSSSASNACRITYDGTVIGKKAYSTSGADYAEYFEWADANVNNEERVGYFVTFEDGRFIRKANENDYILGIVSGNPAILGNHDECWMGQNEMDEWGRFIYETKTEVDEKTKEEHTYTTYKINPDYDRSMQYIPRSERPEWDAIGMLGVLAVRDDGTCKVNGYCKVADGGIATASDTGYRVIERVTDNIIKVVFR